MGTNMKNTLFYSAAIALTFTAPGAVFAQDTGNTVSMAPEPAFEKFRPTDTPIGTRIDYSLWDDALEFFVFNMGRSIREGAPRVDASVGTRRVYGHESRYRLEGNRIVFSYLEDDVIASLSEYRADLENTGSMVDIATLDRNEQLAFWLNLHNVAIIEQIARNYPVNRPSSIRMGDSKVPMDEARFITVGGVSMSPRDIRTRIVYPNWTSPKVMYGFFRGEIGGPSIQPVAFTAANVSSQLEDSAEEFINSLRGTEKVGKKLQVSKILEEARPFYFKNWDADVRRHLLRYSNKQVTQLIEDTDTVAAELYETDIADLAGGERDPNYSFVIQGDLPKGTRIPNNVARLLVERSNKMEKIFKRSDIEGRVTVIQIGDLTKPAEPETVD